MSAARTKFLKYWLPAIVWAAVIMVASTDLMSAQHTSRFIGPFLRWISPDISPAAVLQVQLFVRKAAHVVEYAILATLLLRALRASRGTMRWRDASAALALAAACAITDEFHQSFVASRTGSPVDVVIDICGALAGLTIYSLAARHAPRRPPHPA